MSHYGGNYEQEVLNSLANKKKLQQKQKLFYSNKIQGIEMMITMVKQELAYTPLNTYKIKQMLDQIRCLAGVD